MGAPIGNKNAVGNSGGGRKTAFGEAADAQFLWEMFTQPVDKAELIKRVKTGRHSILDAMVMRALAGSDRLIGDVFKKLFPDSLFMTANLNQKQLKNLEDNVRTILEVATMGNNKKRVIIGSNPERLSASIKAATEAMSRAKKKKKKVVKRA